MKISNYNSNTTFEKAYFDKDVKKIIKYTPGLTTNYLRNMFETYHPESTVLFSLDKVSNKISATNLNTGYTYPRTAEANGIGLNNLIGELLNQRTNYHKTFWETGEKQPDRLGCYIEHEFKDGKAIYTFRKTNGYHIPYKKRILDKNGEVTIVHQYANGYKIVLHKKDNKFELENITHRDIIPPLYDNSKGSKFNRPILSEETIDYYKKMPKVWRKYCLESLEALFSNLKNN